MSPSPVKVYAQRWDINFTAEQASALRAEAVLRGVAVGDVVRLAVSEFLRPTPTTKGRKKKGSKA